MLKLNFSGTTKFEETQKKIGRVSASRMHPVAVGLVYSS